MQPYSKAHILNDEASRNELGKGHNSVHSGGLSGEKKAWPQDHILNED